jgi:hypothetical protein
MDHEFHSIIEKLAVLEGRISPPEKSLAESKQKKPALFNNLKAKVTDEANMEEDVVGKVKASLADYLKSAEDNIKQDKDLIAKKKQDLDIKKKELKDLDLQQKEKKEKVEEEPMIIDEAPRLQIGDPIAVIGPNEYEGEFGEVVEFAPSGNFVVVKLRNGDEASMHISDVELTADDSQLDGDDWDEDDGVMFEPPKNKNHPIYKNEEEVDEADTYAQGGNATYATGGNATYASESAPVKTMEFELNEMGGGVLVEIHGDERQGFSIRRAGKELSTRFKSLAEAELALEMFAAHRARQQAADQSADYIEEK